MPTRARRLTLHHQEADVHRVGCHIWCGPDLEDLRSAARARTDAPEVWAASTHPHLHRIARLWPGATIYTVGGDKPELDRLWHIHQPIPADLELLTLDRPQHTIVCP